MTKTNNGLVEYAKAQLGKPYWYGCFGQKSSKSLYNQKKKQYPKYYTANDFTDQLGVKVHDCIGLIKGYLWSNSPTDLKPAYSLGQDVSADGMYVKCNQRGEISSIPELAGVLVFMDGHVGVYIGDGYVIEARGHQYGVVKTKLSSRGWKHWGKCPYIDYGKTTVTNATSTTEEKFDKTYKNGRAYKTTAPLHLRSGAGTDKSIIGVLQEGTSVIWYGYYTQIGNKVWRYVKVANGTHKGKVGYCSGAYLK